MASRELFVDWPPMFNDFQRRNFAIGDVPDLRIKVGDNNVFAVHKSVLAATCPAILELLSPGSCVVEIQSTPEAVLAMLQFIYEDLDLLLFGLGEARLLDVWNLAGTYSLLELKRKCEANLFTRSMYADYIRYAGLAAKMGLPEKLKSIINRAARSYDTLVFDSEWDALKLNYPETALQLLEAVITMQWTYSYMSRLAANRHEQAPAPGIAPLISHAIPFELPVQWRIADFRHLRSTFKPGQFIVCEQKFSHESLPGIAWELLLYPNGTSAGGVDHIAVSMRLLLTSNKKSQATAPFAGFSLRFEPAADQVNANATSAPPPLQTLAIQQILPSDELGFAQFAHQPLVTEHCIALDGSATLSGVIQVAPPASDQTRFLRNLFESGSRSDFTIKAREESFAVHTNILSMASPVMNGMFDANCSEMIDGFVEMQETTVEAVRALLQFWYGDPLCFDGSVQLAMDVYTLANRYQDFKLQQICEDALLRMASLEHVLLFAAFAVLEKSERLEEFTSKLFIENAHDIFRSDEWARIKKDDFKLALQICEGISKYPFVRP